MQLVCWGLWSGSGEMLEHKIRSDWAETHRQCKAWCMSSLHRPQSLLRPGGSCMSFSYTSFCPYCWYSRCGLRFPHPTCFWPAHHAHDAQREWERLHDPHVAILASQGWPLKEQPKLNEIGKSTTKLITCNSEYTVLASTGTSYDLDQSQAQSGNNGIHEVEKKH